MEEVDREDGQIVAVDRNNARLKDLTLKTEEARSSCLLEVEKGHTEEKRPGGQGVRRSCLKVDEHGSFLFLFLLPTEHCGHPVHP